MNDLVTNLKYIKEFKLEGFTYDPPPYGGLFARFFTDLTAQEHFDAFAQKIISALGTRYLPVYRMADGEFEFMVGKKTIPNKNKQGILRGLQYLKFLLNLCSQTLLGDGIKTCWGECYTRPEIQEAKERFRNSLRHVAEKGILAPYFFQRPDLWGEAYFEPVCQWLQQNTIPLHQENYIPFYSVYALLNGSMRHTLFRDKHLLVVTYLTEERKQAIKNSLNQKGVASVQLLSISSNKSLLDTVDLSGIRGPLDLAIVGAGIGSVNILQQLEPLSIPCIDSGISIECLIDSSFHKQRFFLLDDESAKLGNIARL